MPVAATGNPEEVKKAGMSTVPLASPDPVPRSMWIVGGVGVAVGVFVGVGDGEKVGVTVCVLVAVGNGVFVGVWVGVLVEVDVGV